MHFDIGPYTLRLPTAAAFPDPSERALPHRALPQFRVGRFDVHVSLMDETLADWREHVEWTTKNQASILSIEVNGIPGLRLPGVDQRLDYTFQSPGQKRIEIVAWSDVPTNPGEREVIERMVATLAARLTIVGGVRDA